MSVSTLLSHLIGLKEGEGWGVRDDVSVQTQIHASAHAVTLEYLYLRRVCQTLKINEYPTTRLDLIAQPALMYDSDDFLTLL